MLTLDNLTADTYNIDQIEVTWEFEPTSETLSNYLIDVYRSESPGTSGISGYDVIASGITLDNTSYTDVSVSGLYDHNRTWYYKIDVKDTVNNENEIVPEEPAYVNGALPDYRAKYIVKYKKIALNKYSGQDLFLLKRRTWGERCPVIWDETLHRVTGERCDECTCYGTGWYDGYFAPISFKGMITPNPEIDEMSVFGEFKPSDAILYMLEYPPLRPSDIIVFKNQRYYVLQTKHTERLGVSIEQQAQISLIHEDDETYNIEVS